MKNDLNGRKEQNAVRVRSVFVDLDGAPIGPVLEHQCEQHMVIESSLAICDLSRVMRLPGFCHHKIKNGQTNGPFMTRIESMYPEITPYSGATLTKYFLAPDVEVEDNSHEASRM